jgi:hypothetical protein
MPIFKALKKIMLSLRWAKHMEMSGAIESDEVYVTAGLKGRNNCQRIRRIGRKPRRRSLRRCGGRISQLFSSLLRGVAEKKRRVFSPSHHKRPLKPRSSH